MEEEDNKLLRKDTTNSSSRIFYYGSNAGAVPFLWESRPGTPKHHGHVGAENPLIPPLTPPPSYLTTSTAKKHPKMLSVLLSKLSIPSGPRRPRHGSSASSSSSVSSSSAWSLGSCTRRPLPVETLTKEEFGRSPRSVMGVFRGCCPVPSVKGGEGLLWGVVRGRQG